MVQKVLRGRGKLMKVAELMDKLNMKKPLLVCGDRLAGVFAEKVSGVEFAHFKGYHPNPDYADCAAGAAMYREQGCDGLISLGGGSAMDTAKAIKAMLIAENEEKAL